MYDQLIKDGFVLRGTLPFAYPVFVWSLDLEVQSEGALTASERTVLRLVGEGIDTTARLAEAMGFGADQRVVAATAIRLIELGGLGDSGRLAITPHGQGMLATARIAQRERTSATVFYRPIDKRWSWKRPAWLTEQVEQTVELVASPASPRHRADEIGDLVKRAGVPELSDRATKGEAPAVELLGLVELNASVMYERIEIQMWELPATKQHRYLGLRDGIVDERLSLSLEGARYDKKRGRLQLTAT